MKPLTHVLMITLAAAFAVAFALTVALLCLSHVQILPQESVDPAGDSLPFLPESDSLLGEDLTDTLPESLPPSPPETLPESEEESETEPLLPDLSNGLAFASNRDGTCRVVGIGTCIDACVVIPEYAPSGERVVAVESGAFFGCATVTAIQIPASVLEIGDLAFSACKNLMYISVNAHNPHFQDVDGILYRADGTELLLYPPMRAGSEVTIYALTTRIADMAFYNCAYLRTVFYAGSPEQWEAMDIGSKNYSLTAAAKSFYAYGK